jgi:hypothetical protein
VHGFARWWGLGSRHVRGADDLELVRSRRRTSKRTERVHAHVICTADRGSAAASRTLCQFCDRCILDNILQLDGGRWGAAAARVSVHARVTRHEETAPFDDAMVL